MTDADRDARTRALEIMDRWSTRFPKQNLAIGPFEAWKELVDEIARALADAEQRAQRAESWIEAHGAHCSQGKDAMTLRGERDDARIAAQELERQLADARRALERVRSLIWGVWVIGATTGEPIAAFEFGDQAEAFGKHHYPGRYRLAALASPPEGRDPDA